MTTLSAAVLLFLVMDPMGNTPVVVALLAGIEPRRARWIIVRELLIALGVLMLFLFAGRWLLALLHISEPALGIAGGIILFLIALRMIFGTTQEIFRESIEGEPLVVPLAVPLIAGPSAAATILLLMAREPSRWHHWLTAILAAWFATGCVLFFSPSLGRLLGRRVLIAAERLMGMLLTVIAVETLLNGVRSYLAAVP